MKPTQDYFITKGTMLITKRGYMIVNDFDGKMFHLTEYRDNKKHAEVTTFRYNLEELLDESYPARKHHVIWKEHFDRV